MVSWTVYTNYLFFQETEIGTVGIAECSGRITNLYFGASALSLDAEPGKTEVIGEAFMQLNRYFRGELKEFSLPLAPAGTPFMQHVWQILSKIPYGTTTSYKEIAIASGNPAAVRAVGMANRRNPLPLFIPCHRVIGSDGSLTGYSGGLALKKKLLELEEGRSVWNGNPRTKVNVV